MPSNHTGKRHRRRRRRRREANARTSDAGGVASDSEAPRKSALGAKLDAVLDESTVSTRGGSVLDEDLLEAVASIGQRYQSSAKRKADLEKDRGLDSVIHYQRLYQIPDDKHQEALRGKFLTESALAYEANMTFSPAINEQSRSIARGGQIARDAQDLAKRRYRQNYDPNYRYKDCTFRPDINPTSEAIAQRRDEELGMQFAGHRRTELMFRLGQEWRDRREALRRHTARQLAKECTFQPQISATHPSDDPRPFVERSLAWQEARDTLLHELRSEKRQGIRKSDRNECTFHPVVNTSRPSTAPNATRNPKGTRAFLDRYKRAREMRVAQKQRDRNPNMRTASASTPRSNKKRASRALDITSEGSMEDGGSSSGGDAAHDPNTTLASVRSTVALDESGLPVSLRRPKPYAPFASDLATSSVPPRRRAYRTSPSPGSLSGCLDDDGGESVDLYDDYYGPPGSEGEIDDGDLVF